MSIIIAIEKSWAAHAYIDHFGKKLPPKPIPDIPKGFYYLPNEETKLILNDNQYLLSHNKFYFEITKNGKNHWLCGNQLPND